MINMKVVLSEASHMVKVYFSQLRLLMKENSKMEKSMVQAERKIDKNLPSIWDNLRTIKETGRAS